jgi:uncharacterized repeat protein (TIGR01451 family)
MSTDLRQSGSPILRRWIHSGQLPIRTRMLPSSPTRWASAWIVLIACALAGVASPRATQAAEPITVELSAHRVLLGPDGKETLQQAATAEPGSRIRYIATYHNTTTRGLSAVVATIPVPPGLTFVAGTSTPPAAQFSSDGTTFTPWPVDPDQAPDPATVRAIRWAPRDLAANARFSVSLDAIVDGPAPVSPPPGAVAPGDRPATN